jgi:uncharacterized protein (DUF4213/DUF364 family)
MIVQRLIDEVKTDASCRTLAGVRIGIGYTAALCPKVYRDHGVTLLAGVRVVNPERVMNVADEGGGGLALKDSVVQVFKRLDLQGISRWAAGNGNGGRGHI